jgi:hypothetical protein
MNTLEEEIDMTTDEALISALTPKQVGDIELQPFSLLRQVMSIDLCRSSSSNFFNAVMTVWVCTLSPLDALKAHENVASAQLSAFAWAEAQGYSITHYKALLDAYKRLNDELAASTKARARGGQDGDAPKNAGGQPRP